MPRAETSLDYKDKETVYSCIRFSSPKENMLLGVTFLILIYKDKSFYPSNELNIKNKLCSNKVISVFLIYVRKWFSLLKAAIISDRG